MQEKIGSMNGIKSYLVMRVIELFQNDSNNWVWRMPGEKYNKKIFKSYSKKVKRNYGLGMFYTKKNGFISFNRR